MTFRVFQSGPCARRTTAAGVGLVAVLLLPSVAMADEVDGGSDEQTETVDPSTEPEPVRPAGPYPYVLAVINGGVVTNVAALSYERDYSGVWASLRASNDAVLRVPVGSAGIGWVVLPDGSLAPEPPPTPPEALPRQPEGTPPSEWARTGDPEREPGGAKQYPYVLAVINGGVVTNVAALSYERDYSGVWASLRASNDDVLRVPVGSAGIGWVVLPDGSLAPEPPPTPPEALPRQPEGTPPSEWARTGDPKREPGGAKQYPYVLAVINGGVVTNVAALSYERDYSGVWASLRASNDAVLRVPVGSAGIGWVVLPDGSLAPPKPRAGMVWNGEEWRAPGTESVQRPSDVRGWMTGRSEPVDRVSGDDRDGTGTFVDSWMFGLLIVPDDALDAGATHEQLADRSIVMLETSGGTIPFLARFDGLARLLERVDEALDSAIAVHEASTGATVPEPEQQGLRSAARRVVEPLLRLFGVGAAISIRPFG